MRLISHRGNVFGPDKQKENKPDQISKVLSMGFDCEIDLWFVDKSYYLGHDKPTYEVSLDFIRRKGLWLHCKNFESLRSVPKNCDYFWHQSDDFTLTSKGYIWTFPEKRVGKMSIIVDNNANWKNKHYDCFAVCSDYIL